MSNSKPLSPTEQKLVKDMLMSQQSAETTKPPTIPAPTVPAEIAAPQGMTSEAVLGAAETEAAAKERVSHIVTMKADEGYYELDDLAILKDASIIARPLSLPDILKIKAVDPHMGFRWINHKGQGGQWYMKMLAVGFAPAVPADIISHHKEVHIVENHFVIGDLKLMKIPRLLLAGFLKHNYERSLASTSKHGATRRAIEAGKNQLRQDVPAAPEAFINDKVRMFEPNSTDLSKVEFNDVDAI